jgi:hypothetical protein
MAECQTDRNGINTYFSQVVSFYNGENATSLIQQKYDDKQSKWVILEWLEAIKFINFYSSIDRNFNGKRYVPEFAHRARVFASTGYNTTLYGGGMLWDNEVAP